MRRLVLIGDSIRMGYEEHVRRALAERAEVISPRENGGTSANVLAHLDDWVVAERPAVVHLNCGLHDLRREFGTTGNAVPIADYARNLAAIFRTIGELPGTVLIWATTTPVNERWHHDNKPFDRFEADVQAYNLAAGRIAQEQGLPIDDLNAVVTAAGRDRLLLPDGVHYNSAGYALLGDAVVRAIQPYL